ncbi:hypothetical protein RAS1_20120 [Phycisphaerae bacterium RAS1]|nr:hypothetical protein RAS1_20120 [Phycisphaerae bacterium RAS1]
MTGDLAGDIVVSELLLDATIETSGAMLASSSVEIARTSGTGGFYADDGLAGSVTIYPDPADNVSLHKGGTVSAGGIFSGSVDLAGGDIFGGMSFAETAATCSISAGRVFGIVGLAQTLSGPVPTAKFSGTAAFESCEDGAEITTEGAHIDGTLTISGDSQWFGEYRPRRVAGVRSHCHRRQRRIERPGGHPRMPLRQLPGG